MAVGLPCAVRGVYAHGNRTATTTDSAVPHDSVVPTDAGCTRVCNTPATPCPRGSRGRRQSPPGRPAHTTPNPENHHTPHTHPVPGALTHHNPNTKPDRSRRGERPISNRKRTDLGTGYDRSRAGEQPISARNRTDLGGVRLAGLTSPGGPRRDDVAPCLKRGRGRRVGASQPALPGRESAARQGRTA